MFTEQNGQEANLAGTGAEVCGHLQLIGNEISPCNCTKRFNEYISRILEVSKLV